MAKNECKDCKITCDGKEVAIINCKDGEFSIKVKSVPGGIDSWLCKGDRQVQGIRLRPFHISPLVFTSNGYKFANFTDRGAARKWAETV